MNVLDWLLDSDPAIRWQALRDLADASAEVVAAERARVLAGPQASEVGSRRSHSSVVGSAVPGDAPARAGIAAVHCSMMFASSAGRRGLVT